MVLKKAWALMFSIPFCPFPNRFCGFLLNSTRRRLCASGDRNCGMPSLALGTRKRRREQRGREGGEIIREAKLGGVAYFKIIVIVAFLFSP